MRKVVREIGILSAGKVAAVLYACVGVFIGAVVGLLSMAGVFAGAAANGRPGAAVLGMFLGAGAIVVLPVLYGVIGAIVWMVGALIYNVAARFVGGLEFEVD